MESVHFWKEFCVWFLFKKGKLDMEYVFGEWTSHNVEEVEFFTL